MTSNDMSEVLYEQLKCQICKSGPKAGKPKWYQCLSHHQICQDCKTKDLTKCPCERLISAEPSKVNQELLKLTTMRFKCKNTKTGCQEVLGKEAMIFHEAECIYRLVKCPDFICKVEVPFHELIPHITKEKHVRRRDYENGTIKFIKLSEDNLKLGWRNFHLKLVFDERIFYVVEVCFRGTFYHWVHLVGSPHEAKNYSYTSEFFGNDSFRSHVYTSKVIPIDETANSIIKNV